MRFFVEGDADARVCAQPCCQPASGLRYSARAPALRVPALAAAPSSAGAAAAADKHRVIDVHHHFFSPLMKENWSASGHAPPLVANWSQAAMLEQLDRNGVDMAILSVASAPLHWFSMSPAQSRPLVRAINEYAARLVSDHPARHGFFGFVTCRDVEGSLREIEYALDSLGAQGIEMATNFADKWPGDPEFDAVFAELDRRKAVVYFHPLAPNCCEALMPNVHGSWIEYPYDTGRAILSLLVNGVFGRYPNIRFIFSHGGGALPVLAERIDILSRSSKLRSDFAPAGSVLPILRQLYYETANATSAPMMAALKEFVPVSQIMFGSDYPYVGVGDNLQGLRAFRWSAQERADIEGNNAQRLLFTNARA